MNEEYMPAASSVGLLWIWIPVSVILIVSLFFIVISSLGLPLSKSSKWKNRFDSMCLAGFLVAFMSFLVLLFGWAAGGMDHQAKFEDIKTYYDVSMVKCYEHSCEGDKLSTENTAIVDVTFFKDNELKHGVIIVDGDSHRAGLFYKEGDDSKKDVRYTPVSNYTDRGSKPTVNAGEIESQ